ncbi:MULTISPECIES: glycoside hydrolase family 32 protein [Cohnella]|uniref:glycoside hydrolase family 32 protein n=1 Tax=Cohnella TaxID=329857 RepID=UPI0009B9BCAC|nr:MULTISPECIES: glycoside hydrolase family 32 protein [Cohnella]MBN2981947.1 glycoside hydrolase family 32 protein [Cohnella algarum]
MNEIPDLIAEANRHISSVRDAVARSGWKPRYHLSPQAGWMNDPNGFIHFRGKYHVFFQHCPFKPEWGPMYWGHMISPDLVHWRHLPIALAPDQEYDRDGCFSGSAIEADGKLYLMYTGNVWTGPDQAADLLQTQCLAVSEDGVRFVKLPENPVIGATPEGDIHPFHFRDPKVWKQGDLYYCVIASRSKNEIGQALLYRSADLKQWEFVNVMAKGGRNPGYMWECPDVFQLDGKDVLVLSPQGMKPEGYLYRNKDQSGYVLGKLDPETGMMSHGPFRLLDYGFDFYAPQTTVDAHGRRVMIAWMNMWESLMPERRHGWAGAMTLPRRLELREDRLLVFPARELEALRGEGIRYENVEVRGGEEVNLPGVEGDSLELAVVLQGRPASRFGLMLRCGEADGERTVLTYDGKEGVLELDRNASGQGPGGERQAPVALREGKLALRVFVDRSSVEVFTEDGEVAMTARIYPGEGSVGIRFFADGGMVIRELESWALGDCYPIGNESNGTEETTL